MTDGLSTVILAILLQEGGFALSAPLVAPEKDVQAAAEAKTGFPAQFRDHRSPRQQLLSRPGLRHEQNPRRIDRRQLPEEFSDLVDVPR